MSQAPILDRDKAPSWAMPGSRHDRLVWAMKYGLPVLIMALLVVLAVAPFDKRGDVSFILDKHKVDPAHERLRVEKARYGGADDKGQRFEISADHAVQQKSNVPVVAIEGMQANLGLDQGPMNIQADRATYNLDTRKVAVPGAVKVAGANGYRLNTSNVTVSMNDRTLTSQGPVAGSMKLGRFSAGQMHADLNSRTVTLQGRTRLKIVQGAVR